MAEPIAVTSSAIFGVLILFNGFYQHHKHPKPIAKQEIIQASPELEKLKLTAKSLRVQIAEDEKERVRLNRMLTITEWQIKRGGIR